MASEEHELVQRFVRARRHPSETLLEGYHAIKHALRFDAEVAEVVALAGTPVHDLPPELTEAGLAPREIGEAVFDRLVSRRPPVPLVARAARRDATDAITRTLTGAVPGSGPVVLLELPTHAGNVGAAVRIAAAAGADCLLVVGGLDPWSPAAIRGAAGLQYALAVGRLDHVPETPRPVVAFDPGGDDLRTVTAPPGAVLAFGTERRGISDTLRRRADLVVRIPMRPRVSSLNLATAVAVALYAFTGPALDR